MKKILLSATLASLLSISAQADFLGAEAGYALWTPSLSGIIKKDGDEVDFEKDLGYGSKENNSFIWAYLDHPIPLLPNIKIQKTNYSDSANGKVTKSLNFANTPFGSINGNLSDDTKSEFTLNQLDIIAYWRILDNWVNLDLGLNIKKIDGNIKIDTTNTNEHIDESFSATVPMLYAKARFDLPFSGLSLESDLSYISYSGNKITDFKAGLSYDIKMGLGAIAGLKTQNFILDDIEGTDADITISGMYLGVFYHF